MPYYEVLFYVEFIGRNALALLMLLVLFKRFSMMQQMGKSSIEVRNITPASYMIRFFLLLSHCILTLLEILLYYSTDELDDHPFNFYKFSWTQAFQISIYTFQIFVMRKEYRRQVSYMKMHQIYWILDLLLYILLFIAVIEKMSHEKLTLPISILVVKVLLVIFSFFGNQNSMMLLEKSFLTQATKYLVDLPSTTARSGMKIISTLNTQQDKSAHSPKKSIKSSFSIQKEQDNRIKVRVKYQFEINKKGEVEYIVECHDYLKQGNKVVIKKNMQEFLQLQRDINSIKNPLNLTNFSYVSSQIQNETHKKNQQNILEKELVARIEDNLPTIICTDRQMLEDNNQNNLDELKIEENAFKQILSLQKYLDYVTKEFYFEEAFLVKFLGLTRKQYYIEVSQLQAQDCFYQNENEFIQFKQDYPKLKNTLSLSLITKVTLETLGNIKNDGVTYYQLVLRKQKLNSGLCLPSYSQPLRYTDFCNFYKALQKEIFPIRLPEFPPKSLLNDKETMYQRKHQLLKFFSIIYNENIYFCKTLFSFQNCFSDYMVQQAQQINNDLFQYRVQLLGKYLNSSKQFLFRLYPKRKQAQTFYIVKRFKDIINLHKDLELYYTNLLQYLVQQAYQEFKEKQLNVEIDPQNNPQLLEEKNILKEIKKTIKIPNKPKNINDCAQYLQEILDCNIYHKCISFRQFLFRFEYLEEMLNENANSSVCFSNRGQSYEDEKNL
ncbi:transmembrane protein, putative (macronuclear) [Tetrahymena thermophila SB210]|uniref:Transmembrane protein, putative n=1 Tax=Tetrahymena thermophila (strain SB210) TaxID=312017 RepID=I7MM86_TETTS|nr:transmembrane protein, putative [Tetrahymena thermophila SB210]EAS04363.2 transmembrane protein, putative [Tetrahymena thermophila SB210]|eukprot:XP_001024608.2 transmembrane protein, putative [Tetrahymena thermophila SB210]